MSARTKRLKRKQVDNTPDWLTITPNDLSILFDTGFHNFTTSFGVSGLAAVYASSLFVLAVHSEKEGKGQFRTFLKLALKDFTSVTFLRVDGDRLRKILAGQGFEDCVVDWDGDQIPGMEKKQKIHR